MSEVLAEREGDVLVLTLNRPEKANAMNEAMQTALVERISTSNTKAILINAAGEKIFSAGADLKEFSELERGVAAKKRRELLKRTLNAILDYPKPLVVAMQGKALGAGAMVALLADELVMAEAAELACRRSGTAFPRRSATRSSRRAPAWPWRGAWCRMESPSGLDSPTLSVNLPW